MAWKIRFVTLIFLLYDSIRLILPPEKKLFPFSLRVTFQLLFRKKEKENLSAYCVDTPHLNLPCHLHL